MQAFNLRCDVCNFVCRILDIVDLDTSIPIGSVIAISSVVVGAIGSFSSGAGPTPLDGSVMGLPLSQMAQLAISGRRSQRPHMLGCLGVSTLGYLRVFPARWAPFGSPGSGGQNGPLKCLPKTPLPTSQQCQHPCRRLAKILNPGSVLVWIVA